LHPSRRVSELRKLTRFRIVEIRQRTRARLAAPRGTARRYALRCVIARVLESGAQTLRRTRCGLCERMRRKHGEKRAERQLKPSPNTPHEHVLTATQGAAYG
jgi:hypothetical protein